MFQDFKTEITLFFIIALVAVVITAGGIFFLRATTPAPVEEPVVPYEEGQEVMSIEPTDEVVERVKENILQSEYAKQITHQYVRKRDITGDGISELILVQLSREEAQIYAYPFLQIVQVLSEEGEYREIATFDFRDIDVRYWESPIVNVIGDLNLDGLVEIHISGNTGSVRPSSQDVFFVFDPDSKTLTEMKIVNKNGKTAPVNRLFLGGSRGLNSAGAWNYALKVGDVDGDGVLEIIQFYEDGPPLSSLDDLTTLTFDRWRMETYKWNGSMYAYSVEFSTSGEGVFEQPEAWRDMHTIDLINIGRDKNVDIPIWKTYRNEDFGFELQHPGDWRLLEEEGIMTRGVTSYMLFESDDYVGETIGSPITQVAHNGTRIIINSYENPKNFTPEQLVADYAMQQNKRVVRLDGVQGIAIDTVIEFGIHETFIALTHDNFVYQIRRTYPEGQKFQYEEEFNQILSTFRFVE